MQEKKCAFSYTAFEYADSKGKGKGRKVKVPEKLNYQKALTNCRILTTTTMFDTEKIKKENLIMPNIKAEDLATWWQILKQGYLAYGLNETLAYYRRTPHTLSANKLTWWINRWKLYTNIEKFPVSKSLWLLLNYAIHGVIKRI